MGNSETKTSSTSKGTSSPSPTASSEKPAEPQESTDSTASPSKSTAKTDSSSLGPTDLVSTPEGPAPESPGAKSENISARIAHPVPHHHVPEPDSVDIVLKGLGTEANVATPLHHLANSGSSTQQNTTTANTKGTEPTATAGGFSGINNWLDSLSGPQWKKLGHKVQAAPATFTKGWRQRRIERAEAAEFKEQSRLIEVAHTEAQAEATKREAASTDSKHAPQEQSSTATRAAATTPPPHAEHSAATEPVEEELHAGNLLSGPAPERQEITASQGTTTPTEARTSVSSTPAPVMDPQKLAALVASAKEAIDNQLASADPVYVAPYALPETDPNPPEEPADLHRRVLGGASAVVATVVSLFLLNTLTLGSVESLGANYALLSLTPTAHVLWPVIFLWSVVASIYSWAPTQRSAVRQRQVGAPFALALVAAVLWMVSAVNGWLLPAFCFSAVSCWFLISAIRKLNQKTARNRIERILTDAPVSLMTGFSLVVLVSTFAAMLQSWGAGAGVWVASILVVALGYCAVSLSMTERGRIILAIGFGWGMIWILVPRVLGTNNSICVAILAGMAAFVTLLATENRRYQIHHAEHRAARGKPTEY